MSTLTRSVRTPLRLSDVAVSNMLVRCFDPERVVAPSEEIAKFLAKPAKERVVRGVFDDSLDFLKEIRKRGRRVTTTVPGSVDEAIDKNVSLPVVHVYRDLDLSAPDIERDSSNLVDKRIQVPEDVSPSGWCRLKVDKAPVKLTYNAAFIAHNRDVAAELAMEFLAFMRNGEGNHEFEAKFRLTLVDKTESDPGMWTSGEVKHEIQDHKTLDAFDISPMRDERRFYALQCTFMVVADHQTVQVSEQLPLRIVVGDGEVMP